MDRLRNALESLDEAISELEDRLTGDSAAKRESLKKQADMLKTSRSREANVMAVAQKVASRLDKAIDHVESILRH